MTTSTVGSFAARTIQAEQIKPGDVIMPPEREVRLWMRRHVQEHNLSDAALHLTVTEVYEGKPDARGRWLVVRTLHNAEWGSQDFPFTFKMRPATPWPLIIAVPQPRPTSETLCLRCSQPTAQTFFCPCDLHHALCLECQVIEPNHDCAFIRRLA